MDIVAFSDEQVDRAAAGMVAIEGGDARAGGADPAAPGRGAGVALTTFARRRAHENRYSTMTTVRRMSNLEAPRFRPRRGFRGTVPRLYRSIP